MSDDLVNQMQSALAGLVRLIDIIHAENADKGHILPDGPTVMEARRLADLVIGSDETIEAMRVEHRKQIAEMAERFRAVNIQRVIEQTGQDIFAMAERIRELEKKLGEKEKASR